MSDLPGTFAKAGTAFLFSGYLSLTVAFVLGILALVKAGKPSPTRLNFEKLHRPWIRLGFLLLACGIFVRAILARATWSEPWNWDRMETWSLIVWLVYGAVLHMNYEPAFKGRKAIWASVLAWGFMLLGYFGLRVFPI